MPRVWFNIDFPSPGFEEHHLRGADGQPAFSTFDCILCLLYRRLPSIFQSRFQRWWACLEWNAQYFNHQKSRRLSRLLQNSNSIPCSRYQDVGCVYSNTGLTKYYNCVSPLQKSRLDPVPAGWTQQLVPGSSPRTQDWPAQGIPQISVLSVYRHQGIRAQLAEPWPRYTQGMWGSDALCYVQWLRGSQGTLNEMNIKRT